MTVSAGSLRTIADSRAARRLADAIGGLAYSEIGRRDRRLDLLRGYCAVAMVVDHLDVPTWLHWFTGGNRFFVSAAEGFVFISGLVMAIVYRPIVERQGLRNAVAKALRRSAVLYAMTVLATLGFMLLSARLGLPWAAGVDLSESLPRVLTLRQTFYLTDVLMLYTWLIAVSPIALWLLHSRRTWLLLLLSWGAWGYHQVVAAVDMPWPSEAGAFFYIVAWQVLFFTAMTIGWHRQRLAPIGARLLTPAGLATSGLGLALLVWFWRSSWILGRWIPDVSAGIQAAFAKWNLPPARLAACAIVFLFAYLVAHYCWKPLRATLGQVLLPLGEAALTAYVVHLIVVAVLTAYRATFSSQELDGAVRGVIFQVSAIVIVWVIVSLWLQGRQALASKLSPAIVTRRLDPALGVLLAGALIGGSMFVPVAASPVAGMVPVMPDRAVLDAPHYLVHLPPDAAARQPLPVLLVLHDESQDPEAFSAELLSLSDREGWLLVAPRINYQADYLDPEVIAAESPGLLRGVRDVVDEMASTVGLRLRRRVMVFGYGRGAAMAMRYTIAYAPDVRSVALLGGGGYTIPPRDPVSEEPPFPFGARGFGERMGREIDTRALRRVAYWVGVGAEDVDLSSTSRAWDIFLGQTRVERAERIATILRRDGDHVEHVVFDGVGAELTPEMRASVGDFFVRTQRNAPILPPRLPRN